MLPALSASIDFPDVNVAIATQRQASLDAVRAMAFYHHRNHIPRHFEAGAASRYGYAPRGAKYKAAKLRRYGSSVDLVKTGRTRDEMTRNAAIDVSRNTAGEVEATIRLQFPWTVSSKYYRPAIGRAVTVRQMADEIAAITPDEMQTLANVYAAEYAQRISEPATPQTIEL